ncbi:glycosyltransferase [Lactobacillus delbrueckii subsp. lactis]|nr:glycosyltransferase [Lactobacillus delbrueckii subsp. lactis]
MATWQEANLLLLPTRAECSAIVFCEAAAYGAPVLTTETGGNSTYVKKKVNGDRLPLSASGEEFADVLEKWVKNGDLDRLSQGAEQMYRDYNSWKAWGDHFNQVVH